MKQRFDVLFPFHLETRATGTIHSVAKALRRSPHHFLRLDLFPVAAPSHKQRHYGWWDLPLSELPSEDVSLVLDLERWLLEYESPHGTRAVPMGWAGLRGEYGYCMLHASLWDSRARPPRMLELRSSAHVLGRVLPLKALNIPVTERCNLECSMCHRRASLGRLDNDADKSVVDPLLNACEGVRSVLLQGLGEPLLFPAIHELVAAVRRRLPVHGEVGLTTNATLLEGALVENLLTSGLDFLYFSVDGASKATYERIRVGADFDRVCDNIAAATRLLRGRGRNRPRFMANFVVQESNVDEIVPFVGLAKTLGLEAVTFSRCLDRIDDRPGLGPDVLERAYAEARVVADRAGLVIFTPPTVRPAEERCFFMEKAVLLASGEVFPCHTLANRRCAGQPAQGFGNVREETLGSIWERSDFRSFRDRVLAGDFPESCSGCPSKAWHVM